MDETLSGYFVDFGEPVLVGSIALTGLFDRPYYGATPGSVPAETGQPQIIMIEADLPGGYRSQAFTVRGTAYTVAGVEPDGHGLITIYLER